jgi:hypothetical protein
VYDIGEEAPAKALIEIAEKDFGLRREESTEPYLDAVVQRMDSQQPSSVSAPADSGE